MKSVWFGIALLSVFSGSYVFAGPFPSEYACIEPEGPGGEVPDPHLSSNSKVELADGEVYTLFGTVFFGHDGNPYMEVDLKKHPWLANARRKANPIYPLEGQHGFWMQFNGSKIRFTCRAHGVIVDVRGNPEYVIGLQPMGTVSVK